jgi:hypothetical protein
MVVALTQRRQACGQPIVRRADVRCAALPLRRPRRHVTACVVDRVSQREGAEVRSVRTRLPCLCRVNVCRIQRVRLAIRRHALQQVRVWADLLRPCVPAICVPGIRPGRCFAARQSPHERLLRDLPRLAPPCHFAHRVKRGHQRDGATAAQQPADNHTVHPGAPARRSASAMLPAAGPRTFPPLPTPPLAPASPRHASRFPLRSVEISKSRSTAAASANSSWSLSDATIAETAASRSAPTRRRSSSAATRCFSSMPPILRIRAQPLDVRALNVRQREVPRPASALRAARCGLGFFRRPRCFMRTGSSWDRRRATVNRRSRNDLLAGMSGRWPCARWNTVPTRFTASSGASPARSNAVRTSSRYRMNTATDVAPASS